MNSYLLEIKRPLQTAAVTIETQRRGKSQETYALLKHTETPNIVRGGTEALYPREGIEVVRRPDAGYSWYHSSSSRCLTFAAPEKMELIKQREWGRWMNTFFIGFFPKSDNLEFYNGDLFLKGLQMIGLSGDTRDGYRVHRACWYEKDPMSEISRLLESDGINTKDFRRRFEIVGEGFFDHLTKILSASSIKVENYVSPESFEAARALQTAQRKSNPKTCIGNLEICVT